MNKIRITVNLDTELIEEICRLPDASGKTATHMVKKLLEEALLGRKEKINPSLVEKFFTVWGRKEVLLHLSNVVKWLNLEQKSNEDLSTNFLRSLASDSSLCNNADLAILAQQLQIDVVELTNIRNLIWERKNTTESKLNKASIYVGSFPITACMLPHLDYIMQNPEKKLALCRVSDNAQLVVSLSSAIALKSAGEVAVTRKVDKYWLSSDMEKLQQMYRDYGGVGFELTYHATLNVPKFSAGAELDWARFTTRYILIEDDAGIIYRRGEILELVEVASPVIVN